MLQKNQEVDEETSYKEAFKVLSPKDLPPAIFALSKDRLLHIRPVFVVCTDRTFVKNTKLRTNLFHVQVFSKDREGCIPPEELKFVLANLPNNVGVQKLSNIHKVDLCACPPKLC